MPRVRLVRGEGRGVSDLYGVRDTTCPLRARALSAQRAPRSKATGVWRAWQRARLHTAFHSVHTSGYL